MKKSKKIFLRILPVLMVCFMVFACNFVLAAEPISTNFNDLSGGTSSDKITGVAKNMWKTVILIVQILAVAAVVFAGLRYMFASADQKADIKKQMVILVIGAVLVFGASTIIGVVVSATEQITTTQ